MIGFSSPPLWPSSATDIRFLGQLNLSRQNFRRRQVGSDLELIVHLLVFYIASHAVLRIVLHHFSVLLFPDVDMGVCTRAFLSCCSLHENYLSCSHHNEMRMTFVFENIVRKGKPTYLCPPSAIEKTLHRQN